MLNDNEFKKYATKHLGINSMHLDSYIESSVTPYIIEERQMNMTQMDVFSRLMMDRIIFLGVPINDYVANVIQAQLLFLESVDAQKDILIYLGLSWRFPRFFVHQVKLLSHNLLDSKSQVKNKFFVYYKKLQSI